MRITPLVAFACLSLHLPDAGAQQPIYPYDTASPIAPAQAVQPGPYEALPPPPGYYQMPPPGYYPPPPGYPQAPGYYPPPPGYYPPPPAYYYPPPAAYYAPPAAAAPAPRCRTYNGDASLDDSGQPFYGTACLEADGRWHIVNQ